MRYKRQKPLYLQEYFSFSPHDRVALGSLVMRMAHPGTRMLEVGSWLGTGSTQVFLEHLQPVKGKLYCVDTWSGSGGVGPHRDIVEKFDVFGSFLNNIRDIVDYEAVLPMKMESSDAACIVADHSFDLVFIDGDHRYEGIRRDIELWRRKVRPGGILCGHDCEGRVATIGEERLLAIKESENVEVNERFTHIHPGVILAVHEVFGDKVNLFSEGPQIVADGKIGFSTIWHTEIS